MDFDSEGRSPGMTGRREFIGLLGGASALAVAGCRLARTRPVARFGVISDTHVTGPECAAELERALGFFRDAGVDAVLHCGDVTNLGYLREWRVFEEVWRRTMPAEVQFIAALGNRDLSDTGKFPKDRLATDAALLIRNSERGRAAGLREYEVNGVAVIASDWKHEGEIEAFMAARERLRDVTKPLVVIQHPHPKGTVFNYDGPIDGSAGCYLKLFPRAWSFSGHSHHDFRCPGSLWRGEFTAAAAGSYYLGPPPDKGGHEVSVFEIYEDRAVLVRRDLRTGHGESHEFAFERPRERPARRPGDVTFVQWNVGHFSFGRGGDTAVTAAESPVRAAAFRRAIDGFDADFIGLSEFNPAFDRAGTGTRALLFGDFAAFEAGPHLGYQCNALASRKAVLKNAAVRRFAKHDQDVYRLVCETEIGGKRTLVVQTHLDFTDERDAEIAELVEQLRDEPRVILAGDFNVAAYWDYAPFFKAGFTAANFGAFGSFATHRRRRMELTPAIDNVLVKGFEIVDVRLEDTALALSDHRAIRCTLRPLTSGN